MKPETEDLDILKELELVSVESCLSETVDDLANDLEGEVECLELGVHESEVELGWVGVLESG